MEPSDTQLRDALAVERTRLANERTLLAYVRTAIMLAATGATLVTIYDDVLAGLLAGWVLVAAGAIVVGIGVKRYRQMAQRLAP